MSREPIMVFHVRIHPEQISRMTCPTGAATIIPFSGHVESELFTGTILPGAADVQTTDASGIRHMRACYMFTGVDRDGAPCRLFVDNNGYFEPGHEPRPFETCPTFLTDSAALAGYLHQARFRAEGHATEQGVDIRVYDVLA